MNCKKGDLAVVVKGKHYSILDLTSCDRFIGRIIECKELSPDGWVLPSQTLCRCGKPVKYVADDCLRPLPPKDEVQSHDLEKCLEEIELKFNEALQNG